MKRALSILLTAMAVSSAHAVPFTETSPTSKGAVPVGVTAVGGIVMDAVGINGTRVVAELSASSLYVGYAGSNPFTIGTQTGLTPALLAQLGGGLSELGIRFTLFDGDSAAGNFDYNQNFLYLNGINVANWSSVNSQTTNPTGTTGGTFSGGGFRDNTLDTGWFYLTSGAVLTSVYNSIVSANQLSYGLYDTDPGDNYFDFTQGVDSSLINTQLPPTVAAPDAGSTWFLLSSAFGAVLAFKRRVLA